MTDAERLTEVEIRLAYLEDAISALDAVVTGQADRIDGLEKINKALYEHIQDLRESMDEMKAPTPEPKPPHY